MLRLICALGVLFLLQTFAFSAWSGEHGEKIRVACVGDSITYGSGVEKLNDNNYPKVLGDLLGDKYDVRNFGRGGATLLKKGNNPYWETSDFREATDWQPQIVILMLGTNDTKSANWKHKEEFATDLAAMVNHFAALPSHPQIYLCKPAPVIKELGGINEPALKEGVLPAIDAVAKDKHLPVIDIHTALSDFPQYMQDGVHPNARGAEVIAKTVYQVLTAFAHVQINCCEGSNGDT